MRLLGTALVIGVLLAACGGSDSDPDRILQIGGVDRTEREWRTTLRAGALRDGKIQAEWFCQSFDGLSETEAADLLASSLELEGLDITTNASLVVAQADILLELASLATTQAERTSLLDEAGALLEQAETLADKAEALIGQGGADMNRLVAIVQEECERLG